MRDRCKNGHAPYDPVYVQGRPQCRPCRAERWALRVTTGYDRDRHARGVAEAQALLGGRCVCCGENWTDFLHFDHVYGGGRTDRRANPGKRVHVYVLRGEAGYQLLCANCNMAKGKGRDCPPGHDQHARDFGGVRACT